MPMRIRQQLSSEFPQLSTCDETCDQPLRLKYPTQKSARELDFSVSMRAGAKAVPMLSNIRGMKLVLESLSRNEWFDSTNHNELHNNE